MQKELEKYYKECRKKHVKYIAYLLKGNRDAAEDVVQDSFLKAFQKLDQYDSDKGKFSTWFNRILFNTLSDYKRGGFDLRSLDNYFNLVDWLNSEASVSSKLDLAKVISNVEPITSRNVVEKFYLLGWGRDEIANAYDLSPKYVGQICYKFRREAKESLK